MDAVEVTEDDLDPGLLDLLLASEDTPATLLVIARPALASSR